MIDMQNFNRARVDRIDNDIKEWRQRQFSGPAAVAGPATISVRFSEDEYAGRSPAPSVLRSADDVFADSP